MLLFALWLRNPVLPYGGEGPTASGGPTTPASASAQQYENDARRRGLSSLRAALATERQRLQRNAVKALDAPANVERAFDYLSAIPADEEGIVLYDGGSAAAWAGQVVVDPSTASSAGGVAFTPFYTTISEAVGRGTRRAVATALIHADPPADTLARAIDETLRGQDVESYSFSAGTDTTGETVLRVGTTSVLRADAVPIPREMARFARVARAQTFGTLFLCAALAAFLGFAWRDRKRLGERLLAVAFGIATITFVPWSSSSNMARAFDPTYYYSSFGGPLTANAAVVAMTGALLMLAVYALIRSRRIRPPKPAAIIAAVFFAAAGIWLLVRAAPGISQPWWGTTTPLWLTWEIPFFLVLFAFWLAAAWLGLIALGRVSTINLRGAAVVAIVSALVASGFVWRTTTEKRLELAAADILRLQESGGDVVSLLRRFAGQLARFDSAGTRADLLKRYAASDLASADLPVSLATWTTTGERKALLALAPVAYDSTFIAALVAAARDSAQPLIAQTLGINGREVLMAVHHRAGDVTTVVVSPRTQLIAPDPFVSLLGFSPPVRTDPPYTLTISDMTPNATRPGAAIRWTRIGDKFHGDQLLETSRGLARAHAEVDLRSLAARTERGVLVVLLDLAIAGFLWALGAMAEGGFFRWVRLRGVRWISSYRGRLTFALSAFFVIPALAFALWSYQRLRNDDREVRELLLKETLDAVVQRADSVSSAGVARPYDTPLFLYAGGLLNTASDSLLDELAPAKRVLPAPVYLSIAQRGELNASWQQDVGGSQVLFGYRGAAGPAQERYIIAAPARSDELTIDRRRRDLTILVLFATVMGALAAFWLSGIAARILARDLELSRIEVARAERVLAWGEMARQVAHEIKNPLTPIRLGVQHLRRARSDPRVNFDRILDENVTRILAEIDRLDEIARAFSRYGSAPTELPPAENVDVAAILRDVVALERMGVGGVEWSLFGAEGTVLARARTDELRDVLLNLFENARLARARKVDIKLTEVARNVMVEIVDDGAGIKQAALPRVFEPQFSTRTTGSGLGLAISRRLLESWGGVIEIASEEGHGARVVLKLISAS
jgi:two-component system, NtrC family, nitrogen regulation sensor histidine kinase NtrY